MYRGIEDYGVIGNLHSVALVGRDGSIDWLCLPHADSPSVFAAILDDTKGGRFSVSPDGTLDSSAQYIPDTNILVTTFNTEEGVTRLTDFMPLTGKGETVHEIFRLVEVTEGSATVRVRFNPAFDYARGRTEVVVTPDGAIASSGESRLTLSAGLPLSDADGGAEGVWEISQGEPIWLRLAFEDNNPKSPDPEKCAALLEETADYWRNWLARSENGRFIDLGARRDMVYRSALVLKLLFFRPTGSIAAAATTSLPESIGGTRNWDYRFSWIRDASFTLEALFNLGHLSEMEGYFLWLEALVGGSDASELQIMYGLRGERELHEEELPHLEGYRGSRPVRIGNAAAKQTQLDIYGEMMDAAQRLSDYVGLIKEETWEFLRSACDHVCVHWREPDNGIWEVRGGPYHFVYSKVMCWVALDRGITIARRYGFRADVARWASERDAIRKEVLERGWDDDKGAFVQHYDTRALDASNLLLPVVGFLPYSDPRVVSNMEATVRELGDGAALYRYRADDGLPGEEGSFLLCTFWLIRNLAGMGRTREAEELLDRVAGASNHLGLFSEEYDFSTGSALGNFPQAFTHIGYINCVVALARDKAHGMVSEAHPTGHRVRGRHLILNEGEPPVRVPSSEVAARLKDSMNLLRGAFFDTERGRVAYELMGGSGAYTEHVELSRALRLADPSELATREDRLAFWVNLYNVIVIHGIIELGVRDSVKEIHGFLHRVKYNIGGMLFSPEDIEHGVLRGNRRPPYRLTKRFGGSDSRLAHALAPFDPRVHFALVCASSSCPPIAVYTPANIDAELDTAGRTFINSGGAVIDRKNMRVSLSRIFLWYKYDFGGSKPGTLRFISRFFYDPEDRDFVRENAERLRVSYQDYDWRLNRY